VSTVPLAAVIQQGGVFDEQIFAGLAARLARPLQVRGQDPLVADPTLPKKTIRRLEFGLVGKGLRQGATGTGGQMFGDIYQALITTLIAQLGESKPTLCPLTRR
jgi:hypothetical protein